MLYVCILKEEHIILKVYLKSGNWPIYTDIGTLCCLFPDILLHLPSRALHSVTLFLIAWYFVARHMFSMFLAALFLTSLFSVHYF